jgi:energy-coupling factor transport system permease protein
VFPDKGAANSPNEILQHAGYNIYQRTRFQLMPHPAVLILIWISLTIAMQSLQAAALLFVGIPLLIIAYTFAAGRLIVLLRRTRWIMLSLLIIYAYATPGVAVWQSLVQLSPTHEGIIDGLLQLCRLAFALAGLAILLDRLSQQQFIGGLYTLGYPLRYVGLSRDRIAVRLALTMHYAESVILDTSSNWRVSIEKMLAPAENQLNAIEIHSVKFKLIDGLLLALVCALLVWI